MTPTDESRWEVRPPIDHLFTATKHQNRHLELTNHMQVGTAVQVAHKIKNYNYTCWASVRPDGTESDTVS